MEGPALSSGGPCLNAYAPGSLLAHLACIPDPRSPHGQRFPLTALLAAAFAAIAQWARSQDIGLMHRLGFPRTPVHPENAISVGLLNLVRTLRWRSGRAESSALLPNGP